jgi:DNA-binding response OmpR family regulator
VRRAYNLGANSYLVKPLTTQQLVNLAAALDWDWKRDASEPSSEGRAPIPLSAVPS